MWVGKYFPYAKNEFDVEVGRFPHPGNTDASTYKHVIKSVGIPTSEATCETYP